MDCGRRGASWEAKPQSRQALWKKVHAFWERKAPESIPPPEYARVLGTHHCPPRLWVEAKGRGDVREVVRKCMCCLLVIRWGDGAFPPGWSPASGGSQLWPRPRHCPWQRGKKKHQMKKTKKSVTDEPRTCLPIPVPPAPPAPGTLHTARRRGALSAGTAHGHDTGLEC